MTPIPPLEFLFTRRSKTQGSLPPVYGKLFATVMNKPRRKRMGYRPLQHRSTAKFSNATERRGIELLKGINGNADQAGLAPGMR